ncbi:multicopper oxidase domain-containing protein [Acidicapsa acidisoli]|uniref:multicopper oxidase domain-containing protein n=1 Tax=Acidicapsa acidisoli TaxID=1615681 RepID=UPI0021DFB494|nr:multicopper oxidase domain-containing protein [Acidicapsa acidisoli]
MYSKSNYLRPLRLRMDFRHPNIVGTFVYHYHILDHEDKGMMGSIQVLPAETSTVAGGAAASGSQ